MEFDQEFEYEKDYPYVDDEAITERYPSDEEDYSWPHFRQGCGFAILDCVCVNDECPTCGGDIAYLAGYRLVHDGLSSGQRILCTRPWREGRR